MTWSTPNRDAACMMPLPQRPCVKPMKRSCFNFPPDTHHFCHRDRDLLHLRFDGAQLWRPPFTHGIQCVPARIVVASYLSVFVSTFFDDVSKLKIPTNQTDCFLLSVPRVKSREDILQIQRKPPAGILLKPPFANLFNSRKPQNGPLPCTVQDRL